MRSYRPEELFDEDGALLPELAALAPEGDRRMGANPVTNGGLRAARTSSCPTSATPPSASTPPARATHVRDHRARRVAARRDRAEPRPVPAVRPGRDRLQPPPGRVRGHEPGLAGADHRHRRPPRARRPGDGGAVRAPAAGLAGGLPAHRPARPAELVRGVRAHRRLDGEPAREVAARHQPHPVAARHREPELPDHEPCLASGPQRVEPSGPRLHRPRRQQEGGDRPGLPAAGRELPAVRRRPRAAEQAVHQRDRRREAAGARLPHDGRGDRALHARPRDLGLGVDDRRRAGRRARRGGRHPDDGDRRGGRPAAAAPPGPRRCGS